MTRRRTMTPAEVDDLKRGATRLAPGFWVDRHGALHVSVPELLVSFGWPDDHHHRELVTRVVAETMRAQLPDVEVIETTEDS